MIDPKVTARPEQAIDKPLKSGQGFQTIIISLYAVLIILFLSGCTLLLGSEPEPCTDAGAIFIDSFEAERNCGWYLYDDESLSGSALIRSGALEISSSNQGEFWWTNPQLDINDAVITVTTRQMAGTG